MMKKSGCLGSRSIPSRDYTRENRDLLWELRNRKAKPVVLRYVCQCEMSTFVRLELTDGSVDDFCVTCGGVRNGKDY